MRTQNIKMNELTLGDSFYGTNKDDGQGSLFTVMEIKVIDGLISFIEVHDLINGGFDTVENLNINQSNHIIQKIK